MASTASLPFLALLLAWAFLGVATGADRPQARDSVVFSKGLRGRIENARLRPAKLRFTDATVTVDVEGALSERFEYADLRIQRTRHHVRLPLFDKIYWLTTLPLIPVYFATGPYFLAGSLGASHALILPRWLSSGGTEHWLSLHSDQAHRCSHLVLPRNKRRRLAILEELAIRSPKELLVRSADDVGFRDRPSYPAKGDTAPDFTLTALDGSPWSLSGRRGKVVLLNFWATWCEPCRKELPQLERLHQRFSTNGLAVVGLSDENVDEVRQFLSENGITYPTLHDHASLALSRYRVSVIPTSLIISRDGRLLKRLEGYMGEAALMREVKPYLAPAN